MNGAIQARLGPGGSILQWLFEPAGPVDERGRAFLLGQLLSAPAAAIMGALCSAMIATVALLRTGASVYGVFLALELVLVSCRFADWQLRERRLRANPQHVPAVDISALLSILWCSLQGAMAFTIMSGDDSLLRVLAATSIMALIGPICARNYAAPRFAFLLVLLCNLPFVAGALASGELWLAVIVPLTPPFLFGAMQIIITFHRTMLTSLAAEATSRHLARHDSLTGILNRQGMDEELSRIVRQQDREMALISIDLDGFKQVNDSYGHGAGDLLLIKVTQRIRRELDDDSLFARMGGDEFMIVMRGASPEEVRPLIERLIVAISRAPYQLDHGATARVGASIGFACLPEDAAGTVELRLCADQALYAAKRAGKGVGLRYAARAERDVIRPLRAAGAGTHFRGEKAGLRRFFGEGVRRSEH